MASPVFAKDGMPRTAYVYSGEGAGQRSILSLMESLKYALEGIQVRQLNSLDLLQGDWTQECAILCFPGGADLPYCKILNGAGNEVIRKYVEEGGSYLGLCAGAYYACARIEFEPGTPLAVEGRRELAFFPGVAKGAVYPGFEYDTENGTKAATLKSLVTGEGKKSWKECRDYSNGGPAFLRDGEEALDGITDLAIYKDGDKGVAAVKCKVGHGVAVLCGTHPELSPWWLNQACDPIHFQRAHPELDQKTVKELVRRTIAVREALVADTDQRERFWKSLLSAAGLEKCLRRKNVIKLP